MAEYIIRPATREDARAIRVLINKVRINPMGLNWRRFLVAVNMTGVLIGCGQIKLHSDGSRELASIAVLEESRGQGVARSIIEELLAHEAQRPLYLTCRARLELFYNKFGFHAITPKEMPSYFLRIKQVESLFNSKALHENRLLVMRMD